MALRPAVNDSRGVKWWAVLLLLSVCSVVMFIAGAGSGGLSRGARSVPTRHSSVVHASGSPARPVCLPKQAISQANLLKASLTFDPEWAACPVMDYVTEIADQLALPKQLVAFDIGCNKGYDTAMLFEAFAPGLGVNRQKLMAIQQSQYEKDVCGSCQACRGTFAANYSQAAAAGEPPDVQLQVHCFEPSTFHFPSLNRARDMLLEGRHRSKWAIHHLALSNRTGTTSFSQNCTGEGCAMGTAVGYSDVVSMSTVDHQMQQLGVRELFMLKIDAEGYDPLVLQGARETLSSHRVQLLLFEYHYVGPWGATPLKSVVDELDVQGYTCYMEGKLLSRLTDCWHDDLAIRQWANVVCGLTGSPVQHLLERHSFFPAMQAWV